MKTTATKNYERKEFAKIYEMVMENGNTALKPLPPQPTRPHLYLVPQPAAGKAEKAPSFSIARLANYILGFVSFSCLLAILSGNGALVGDLLGAGVVAYFSVRALGEA